MLNADSYMLIEYSRVMNYKKTSKNVLKADYTITKLYISCIYQKSAKCWEICFYRCLIIFFRSFKLPTTNFIEQGMLKKKYYWTVIFVFCKSFFLWNQWPSAFKGKGFKSIPHYRKLTYHEIIEICYFS